MSQISKDGYEQLKVVRNALDSMYEKLESSGQFANVQSEFEAIAGIIELAGTWQEI